jgi:hypothetical protein
MQAAAPQAVVLGTSASRLHRILKTVYAMLRKRGYVVPDDFLRMKAELFAEKYGSDIVNRKAMTVLAFKESNVDEKIYVFFPDGDISAKEITAECVCWAAGRRRQPLPPPPSHLVLGLARAHPRPPSLLPPRAES